VTAKNHEATSKKTASGDLEHNVYN